MASLEHEDTKRPFLQPQHADKTRKYKVQDDSNSLRTARMRRADYACALILILSTSFILFRKPALRTSNPLFIPNNVYDAKHVGEVKEYRFITYSDLPPSAKVNGYAVTYNERSFVIDGAASILLGGSIHYTRSTPQMWDQLLKKAREDGLNFIQLYIFWNFHERKRGVFEFVERGNLTDFYERTSSHGLFLHVRFGPYVCAEWDSGGIPYWLSSMKGMQIRSSHAMWKSEMARIVNVFMDITRPYLAKNGGPVIMAQIENEYNGEDQAYVDWCGDLARSLNAQIPWVMCNGKAAKNTILSCNSNDCSQFARDQVSAHRLEPLVWTEDEAWYQTWDTKDRNDKENPDRSPESVAYAVARWFALGGAMHNYYMYHGGNNYGRTASAGVTTMYANGANLHFDGLSNEPKRSHLRHLHEILQRSNDALLRHGKQVDHAVPLGTDKKNRYVQRAYVYGSWSFLENESKTKVAHVIYQTIEYYLPPQSVVILHGSNVLYNTSAVPHRHSTSLDRTFTAIANFTAASWKYWSERETNSTEILRDKIVSSAPLEQLRVTQHDTDYLMYQTKLKLGDHNAFTHSQDEHLALDITSCDANGFIVFANDRFAGERHLAYPGNNCSNLVQVSLGAAKQYGPVLDLAIVSVSLGLYSLGHQHAKGLIGEVRINAKSITHGRQWIMTPGLLGEQLMLYDPKWSNSVPWTSASPSTNSQPMTWYATSFVLPYVQRNDETSILLDCHGLTRGRAFVNGHDIGRYWLIRDANDKYVQQYYHIPFDWLVFNGTNHLILLEDIQVVSLDSIRIVRSSIQHSSATLSNEKKVALE